MLARQNEIQMHSGSDEFLSVWMQTCVAEKCPS